MEFRRVVFFACTGFAGMDDSEYVVYPKDTPNKEIDEDVNQFALNNAEMYGIYSPPVNYSDDEEDEDCYGDEYSDDICGWWEDFDPENIQHQGLMTNSCTEEECFQELEAKYRE
jgi:hypothetical protein